MKSFFTTAIGNLKSLFKKGFFYIFLSSALCNIIAFFSGIIIVRILSKGEYGIFSYAHNTYNFFYLVSGLGISQSVVQLLSESKDEQRRSAIFNYSFCISVCINLALGASIALFSLIVPLPIQGSNLVLLALSLVPVFSIIYEIKQMKLRADKKNKEFAIIGFVYALLSLASSACLPVG